MELPYFDLFVHLSKALSFIWQYKAPLLTFLSLSLLRTAYLDYSGWYRLGAGGIPHNVYVWFLQNILRLRASRDRWSTTWYVVLKKSKLEQESFLNGDIPRRAIPRTSPWVVPHRQLQGTAGEKLKQVGACSLIEYPASYSY